MPRILRLIRLAKLKFWLRTLKPKLMPLWLQTVWGKEPDPSESQDMTDLRRHLYPRIDLGIFAVGIGGVYASVPALSQLYSDQEVDTLCIALALMAALAFVGVTIPKLWPLEVLGKSMIFGALIAYFITLLLIIVGIVGAREPENRIYLLGGVYVVIRVIYWRLRKLVPVMAQALVNRWARDAVKDADR